MKSLVLVVIALIVTLLLLNVLMPMVREDNNIEMVLGMLGVVFLMLGWTYVIVRYLGQNQNLRNKLPALVIIIFAALSGACTTIPPGYAGIVVNMYGQNRGVSDYPIKTGRVWYSPWSEDVFSFPCYVQSDKWIDGEKEKGGVIFNDRDGMRVGMGVSYSYKILCDKVPNFYVEFRTDDLDAFEGTFLKNTTQEFFNAEGAKRSSEQLYGLGKEEFMALVKQRTNERLGPLGIELNQFAIIGEMNLPDQVKRAIESKLTATQNAQRVENELRETEAAAKKKIAEAEGNANSAIANAKGQAEANRLLTESITPSLLEWRRLSIQQQQAERWNGTLPTTVLGGTGAVPLFNVNPR